MVVQWAPSLDEAKAVTMGHQSAANLAVWRASLAAGMMAQWMAAMKVFQSARRSADRMVCWKAGTKAESSAAQRAVWLAALMAQMRVDLWDPWMVEHSVGEWAVYWVGY